MLELNIPVEWGVDKKFEPIETKTELGNGYQSVVSFGTFNTTETWTITSSILTENAAKDHLNRLKIFQGSSIFTFQGKSFRCETWNLNKSGIDCFKITADLIATSSGSCVEFVDDNIDSEDLDNYLAGSLTYLQTYSGITNEPYLANAQYGLKNSFHRVYGRGGYFYYTSGTSEGQFLIIRACLEAYKATNLEGWKTIGLLFADYLPTLYDGNPIPTNSTVNYLPHWLFNVGETFPTKEPIAAKPINSGVFGVPITFTNGVGTIPNGSPHFGERLSDVTIVASQDSELLWQNIYSELISGSKYDIDYWVVNLHLGGSNYRIYPDGSFLPTAETPGKIKLKSTFTGTGKVTFLRYSNTSNIVNNELYDAYPCWRELEPGEINVAMDSMFWAHYTYTLLSEITNDIDWENAVLANAETLKRTAQIINLVNWYRRSDNPIPLEYPGSQIIQVNNPNPYTVLRLGNGSIQITVQANPGDYPSIELQNFAVQSIINPDATIYAESGLSIDGYVQVVFSLSKNAFDLTQLYIYNWKLTTVNTLENITIKPKDFIRWDLTKLTWFPSCAETPVYTYSGNGSSASSEAFHTAIGGLYPMVYKLSFGNVSGGYAGGGLSVLGKVSPEPPRMVFRVVSGSIRLRIKDGSNANWETVLNTTAEWQDKRFQWSDFTGTGTPDGANNITAIEFIAEGIGNAEIQIYWASIGNYPEVLEDYAIVYKGSLKDSINANHNFLIGDFKPINSVSNNLRFNPGVVPFTTNTVNGNIDSWRGVPYSGYQDSAVWHLLGLPDRAETVLNFALESQKVYEGSVGVYGPFTPVFSWAYWDSGDYAIDGINAWGWQGADPNTQWEGYQYRLLEAIAKHWYFDRRNKKAERVVMGFLNFLDSHYLVNQTNQPPTDYPESTYPATLYHTPHGAALILRAAIYANLAGGNPGTTFRVLYKNYQYLQSNYVSTGNMAGSFSANQPLFTVNSVEYREYFGFWHGEIIEALAVLRKHRDEIVIPRCENIF